MKNRNKWLKGFVIFVLVLLFSYSLYNIIYYDYFTPLFRLEENVDVVTIKGTDYSIHRLNYHGTTYISDPLEDANKYKLGKKVGKTNDGMSIYRVKDDDKHLILKGFMLPPEVYKKTDTKY